MSGYKVYQDRHSKTWLVAGKEHSWGCFRTAKEARAFIAQVEKEDQEYRERWAKRPRVENR